MHAFDTVEIVSFPGKHSEFRGATHSETDQQFRTHTGPVCDQSAGKP